MIYLFKFLYLSLCSLEIACAPFPKSRIALLTTFRNIGNTTVNKTKTYITLSINSFKDFAFFLLINLIPLKL